MLKSLAFNVLSNLLLYIGHLIIARQLLRDDYATFVVVVSIVSLSALFADLGLTGLFIRKFAEAEALAVMGKQDTRGELLGSILGLRLILAVVVSVAVIIIIPMLGYSLGIRHLIMIMLVTFFISSRIVVVRSVGEAFLRAANKYHVIALLAVIDALFFTSVLYFFSGKTLDLETAVWIYSFCHLPGFLLLCGIIYYDGKSVGFRLKFRFSLIHSMIRESLPFVLSTAFLTIHSQADVLLLDKLSSSKQVSAFGAGLRVLSALVFLPMVFSAILGPMVTNATVTKDFESIRAKTDRSLRLLLSIALFIAIMLSVSSDFVMKLLFGIGKYSDAAPLVTLFGWTFIPICLGAFITDLAVAEGKFWLPTQYTAILMVTSIACDFLLIPSYGAFGVAIAKCISVSLGGAVLLLFSEKLLVINQKKLIHFFVRIAVIAICALCILQLLSYFQITPLIILIIEFVVFLINLVFVFKMISSSEIALLVFALFPKLRKKFNVSEY